MTKRLRRKLYKTKRKKWGIIKVEHEILTTQCNSLQKKKMLLKFLSIYFVHNIIFRPTYVMKARMKTPIIQSASIYQDQPISHHHFCINANLRSENECWTCYQMDASTCIECVGIKWTYEKQYHTQTLYRHEIQLKLGKSNVLLNMQLMC